MSRGKSRWITHVFAYVSSRLIVGLFCISSRLLVGLFSRKEQVDHACVCICQ